MADYKTPQWLLPNEKNLAYPAAGDGITGSGLSEDRHSLYSMDFDGSNYIDLGTDLDIFRYNINESYSVSLWYKTTSSTADQTIINLGANAYRFTLATGASGKITFGAGNSSTITVTYNWLPTAGAINDGNWHHICIVQDSSGGVPNLTAYVDGSSSGSGIGTTFITQNNNRIGDGHYGGVEAGIDEVAIFNYALSAPEVLALSTASAPANVMALSNKPIAYYPLGEQAQMGSANWSFPNGSLQSHVVDFDGTDYVSTGLSLAYAAVPTWTISYWIKCDAASFTNFQSYFPIGASNPVGAYNYSPGRLYFFAGLKVNSQGATSGTGTTDLSDGRWHNVVQTYVDQGAGSQTTKIYVDGNSTPEVTANTVSYYPINGDLFIGFLQAGSSLGAGNAFIGEISNVAVWSSDQSANLNNIYNNGSPQSTYTATPTAWWKLNAANSSYVFPWTMSITGDPDYTSSNDGCYISSGVLKWRDTGTPAAFTDTFDWYSKEITGANTNITISSTGGEWQGESSSIGLRLFYKIDGGSWVQFQEETHTGGYSPTAWTLTAPAAQSSSSSFQLKVVGFGGASFEFLCYLKRYNSYR